MTITNYTFFSPNGNDFPVTANADGKLYMMLTQMDKGDFRRRDWQSPINSALNRIYVNTSLVVGGRYFELQSHSVTLFSETTNYIHAVIDLSNTSSPVTITAEKTNTSNATDINNGTGILKVCFETVVTTTSSITSATPMRQYSSTDYKSSTISKVFTGTSGNGQWIFYRSGNIVQVDVRNMPASINSNTIISGVIPEGYRPLANNTTLLTKATNRINLNRDGSIKADNNALTSNDGYFSFSYITGDAPLQ